MSLYEVIRMVSIYVICETYSGISLMTLDQYETERPFGRIISTTRSYELAQDAAQQMARDRDLLFRNWIESHAS